MMTSKAIFEKVLSLIDEYNILPLFASIPTVAFILYQLFPQIKILDFDMSYEAAVLIFLLVMPFLGIIYLISLFILSPYLIYMYCKSLKSKTPLSRTFWLINGFFCILLLFGFIMVLDCNSSTLFPKGYIFYKLIYGSILFEVGICCSVKQLKYKKLAIIPILIFIAYHLLDNRTTYLFVHITFFAEIFLINQILNKPYLRYTC